MTPKKTRYILLRSAGHDSICADHERCSFERRGDDHVCVVSDVWSPRDMCSYVFSALKLWLICNYVLLLHTNMESVFKARKSNVNRTKKKKKWDCWVRGEKCFVQFLLRIKACFVMQSIRNGPKKPSFHLPYLQPHSLDWVLQQKGLIVKLLTNGHLLSIWIIACI